MGQWLKYVLWSYCCHTGVMLASLMLINGVTLIWHWHHTSVTLMSHHQLMSYCQNSQRNSFRHIPVEAGKFVNTFSYHLKHRHFFTSFEAKQLNLSLVQSRKASLEAKKLQYIHLKQRNSLYNLKQRNSSLEAEKLTVSLEAEKLVTSLEAEKTLHLKQRNSSHHLKQRNLSPEAENSSLEEEKFVIPLKQRNSSLEAEKLIVSLEAEKLITSLEAVKLFIWSRETHHITWSKETFHRKQKTLHLKKRNLSYH